MKPSPFDPITVGKPYPKAWIIGKTIEQITNEKPNPKTK
jgi:hypothetical protein